MAAVASSSQIAEGRGAIEYKHRRTAAEVHRCKAGHRSELEPSDWDKFGYARKEDDVCERPIDRQGQTLPIPRINRNDVTVEEFFECFMKPRRPCIIEGAMDSWPAMTQWDIGRLLDRMRHASLKVGEDDKGHKLRMKFKYFADYMEHQQDDSPLYLFETRVEGDPQVRDLLNDFSVPDLFPHDFFDLVNAQAKPPFRWWSIGPRRSGTTVHIDPLGTGAWNAVTHGRKRWVLFEPRTPARLAKGKDVLNKEVEDDEAIMYFDFLLPRIKQKHPDVRIYEAVQGPGDIIFVPSEWWHGVLNLEDTVSVTQNYCGLDNFDLVWLRTRRGRKKLAYHWLRNMKKFEPTLHARAMQLNERDGFKMRHERDSDDSSSSDSSSDSESSSDSSSDEDVDLDYSKIRDSCLAPPWRKATSFQSAFPPRPPCRAPPRAPPAASELQPPAAPLHGLPLVTTAGGLPRKRPHALAAPPEEMVVGACA